MRVTRVARVFDDGVVAGQVRGPKHASLRSQIIRAAMSVPTNIVEGCGQQRAREFSRFLRIALNSTSELESPIQAVHSCKCPRSGDEP